jgi:hypothetical protein
MTIDSSMGILNGIISELRKVDLKAGIAGRSIKEQVPGISGALMPGT